MEKTIVEPTGTCFEDVTLEYNRRIKEDLNLALDKTFVICHGICLAGDDLPYSHAWIEEGESVWFSGKIKGEFIFAQTSKKEFYDEARVQEVTKYNYWEAMAAAKGSGNKPPPWKLKYRKLCKDFKDPIKEIGGWGVKVYNEIKVYEVDGTAVPIGDNETIMIVQSHWNYDDRVVIRIGDQKLTVIGRDLEKAIRNAMNHK